MLIQEVIDQFLYNRKHGLAGSKGKAAANTLSVYEYALRPFAEFMDSSQSKVVWEHLTNADIRRYVEAMTERVSSGAWGKARSQSAIKVLKAMMHWLEEDEDCVEEGLKSFRTKLPVAGKTPRREFIPTPLDLKRFKRSFQTHTFLGLRDWLVFSMLLETGMRRGELCSLKVEYLQLENKQIYIPEVAGNKTGSRTIAITEVLARNIKIFLRRRSGTDLKDCKYLLSSKKSEIPKPDMITKLFRRIRQRKGLAHVTPHTMRHAFCTYYLKQGGSLARLRNMTGHKSYDTLLHYEHLAQVGGNEQKDELEACSPLKMLDETRD